MVVVVVVHSSCSSRPRRRTRQVLLRPPKSRAPQIAASYRTCTGTFCLFTTVAPPPQSSVSWWRDSAPSCLTSALAAAQQPASSWFLCSCRQNSGGRGTQSHENSVTNSYLQIVDTNSRLSAISPIRRTCRQDGYGESRMSRELKIRNPSPESRNTVMLMVGGAVVVVVLVLRNGRATKDDCWEERMFG